MAHGELPHDEPSEYRVEATTAGFVITVKQLYDGGYDAAMLIENEFKYLLTDGAIALLDIRLVAASFNSERGAGIDVFATEDSERPWFRFPKKTRLSILSCRITPKRIRLKISDGKRTAWADRDTVFRGINERIPCPQSNGTVPN